MNYEKRMQRLRAEEARREILSRSIHEDKRISQVNLWQDSLDLKTSQKKNKLEQYLELKEEHKERIRAENEARRIEKHRKLLERQEAERRENEEMAKRLEIERIIENDPRLRDLKSKLNLAYIRKARAKQLEEKAVQDFETKKLDAAMDEIYLSNVKDDEAIRRSEIDAKLEKQRVTRDILLEQIREKEKLTEALSREEFELEKDQVNAIVAQVLKEEAEDNRRRIEKQEQTRQEIAEYERQWRANKRRNEELLREEEAAIEAYRIQKQEQELSSKLARKAEAAKKNAIYEQILKEHEEMLKKEEDLIRAREILNQEFYEAKLREKELAKLKSLEKMRVEMMEAYESQKQKAEQLKLEQMEERKKLREIIMQKYLEDERKEKELEAKRLMDKKQLRDDLDQQRDERFRMYNFEKKLEEDLLSKQAADNLQRDEIVRQEMLRILAQHKDVISDYGIGTDFAAVHATLRKMNLS